MGKKDFTRQGFQNGGLKPWKEVKRRNPNSGWYGFQYKGENRKTVPYRTTKDGKRAKKQRKLNFSLAATRWPVLHNSGDLKNSLRYIPQPGCVTITSDLPYAQVQNEGGPVKVFGKRTALLPARRFVGESRELDDKIRHEIDKGVTNIFNS
ncbi:MAG: hypothetical protein ACI30I_06175 [Parabacteroides sp.]